MTDTIRAGATAEDPATWIVDGKPHPGRRMSEDEFVAWCDDVTRAEWVDGEVVMMAAVDARQELLFRFLSFLLEGFNDAHDLGLVLGPNFSVRLAPQRRRRVPDLLFLANRHRHRFHETYVEGPPDLIMEITCDESSDRDRRDKFAEYQTAKVPEYWLFDLDEQRIYLYHLDARGRYRAVEPVSGRYESAVLPGFYLRPEWIWRQPRPRLAVRLRELGVL